MKCPDCGGGIIEQKLKTLDGGHRVLRQCVKCKRGILKGSLMTKIKTAEKAKRALKQPVIEPVKVVTPVVEPVKVVTPVVEQPKGKTRKGGKKNGVSEKRNENG